eukprot:4500296-Lingulodinium_polyedra.AAC.1
MTELGPSRSSAQDSAARNGLACNNTVHNCSLTGTVNTREANTTSLYSKKTGFGRGSPVAHLGPKPTVGLNCATHVDRNASK